MTLLKQYRKINDLTQQEMANKMNCSIQAYRNYEKGLRVIPHSVLIRFLRLRGYKQDLELADILEEIYEKNAITR